MSLPRAACIVSVQVNRVGKILTTAALVALVGCLVDAARDDLTPVSVDASLALPEVDAAVVVLVAIDGVRWQDVFHGVERRRALDAGLSPSLIVDAATLTPVLHTLATREGAAVGATRRGAMHASGPNFVSLPGYAELFTGSRAPDCQHNDCAAVTIPTIADELAVDGDPGRVAVFSSWPRIARAAASSPERILLSAGRDGTNDAARLTAGDATAIELYELGERANPKPGWGSYRPDAHTAALALHYLRRDKPRFMFLGLGDTDEHAHHDDYPAYLDALRHADAVIGDIHATLRAFRAEGTPTLLLVTTDHGRADNFVDHGGALVASSRVWLIASGDAVSARGFVHSPEPRHLADVAMTIRAVTGLDTAPATPGAVLGELFARPAPLVALR